MASPFTANHVTLSSGQIQFSDPSKPWTPYDFPNLPSTSLTLTAQGRAIDGNVSTLTLTNQILYEAFEPSAIRSNLAKSFLVGQDGVIRYGEAKIGYVSTSSAAFDYGTVSNFQQPAIGGPSIQDVMTGSPDTVTNAVGKLDAWIANAFLFQPPAVTPVEQESNAFWGGVRWNNFKTYAILDKSMPFVNSILLILGDPATPNYLTLEITDPQYFPLRTYTDGISPYFAPLVRLRIFTDFFPPAETTAAYTKATLASHCIRVVSESGTFTLPSYGKVAAVEKTNANDTYTTLSLYLPNLTTTYPKDTPVPVRIVYLNATAADTHIALTSTIQTSTGGPGPFVSVVSTTATQSSLSFQLTRPTYSDLPHLISTPYFSTYTGQYTFKQFATAYQSNVGFRYGIHSPTDTADIVSSYVNSTFSQSFCANATSTQAVTLVGPVADPVIPGVLWSTAFYATNAARIAGVKTSGGTRASLFPTTDLPPSISSIRIENLNSTITRYIARNEIRGLSSGTVANTWSAVGNVSTDVVYISSTGVPITTLQFQLSTPVQFNDASYPGDRSTISAAYTYKNAVALTKTPAAVNLTTTPPFENFNLSTTASTISNGDQLRVNVLETQSLPAYQRYFYKTKLEGYQPISTISTARCALQFRISNTRIPGGGGAPTPQTHSSIVYEFQTEPENPPSTLFISTTRTITNTTQIAGLTTPTPLSQVYHDVTAMNFAHNYAFPTFASSVLQFNGSDIGPLAVYASNVYILNGSAPVASRPFPQKTPLRLSSLAVSLTADVYQDPFDPRDVRVANTLTPANPVPGPAPLTNYCVLSSLFVDTVSYPFFNSSFTSTLGTHGKRVLSLLPRLELPGTVNDMGDSVDISGNFGIGLNVTTSSFFVVSDSNTITVSSSVFYSHASSLSNATYTDLYTRELLYTNAQFIHPAGHNFSQFSTNLVGVSNTFPDFTYDLVYDVNKGNRYATFAYEFPTNASPTASRFLYVKVNAPNLVSSIQATRVTNNWWPNFPVSPYLMSTMKVRLHAKLLGAYYTGTYQTFESQWVNGFKEIDQFEFDDAVFDAGAAMGAQINGEGVEYKIAFNRRYYTKLMALVRVGIAQDGSVYSGEPITFKSMSVRVSDV